MKSQIFAITAALLLLLIPTRSWTADQVEVTGGTLEGTKTETGVRLFKGIPFAAPPVGERRWKAPAPVESWDGVRKADEWETHCMQGQMFGGPLITRGDLMGEDCLYLNVWTPAENADASLPVFVTFHGGGFAAGAGAEPRTDGEWFAQQGIVVVAPNYRLGLFGFLAHPTLSAESSGKGSGNYGMLDQVAALEWVRDNIRQFGGDPDNVTVNGESAGSMSVSALMASPLSRDLVHRGIGQSGAFFPSPSGGMPARTLAEKEKNGLTFAASVGAESLADLRNMSAEKLLSEVMRQYSGWGYSPGVDGYFMPRPFSEMYAAGEQAGIPLMAGWTSSELGMSIAFNPEKPTVESFKRDVYEKVGERAEEALKVYPAETDQQAMKSAAAVASDLFISYATWKWIETHKATSEAPIYRYRFDRTIPGDKASEFGAVHAVDIEYAFNTLDSKQADWRDEDRQVANTMAMAFANFIRTGNPNGDGVPEWPDYRETGKVMYFDDVSKAGPEEYRERYEFLDSLIR